MSTIRRSSCRVRQWSARAGWAAAAAATIGVASASAARADAIDDLLVQSAGDINDAATIYSGIDASLLPAQLGANIGGEVSALQSEADLVSQIQSQQDSLSEALQSSSQLVGADNQLATASGDLLSAVNGYVNAADAGDYVTGQGATLAGEVTGYFDRLDVVYAEVFQFLPAVLNAEFTTLFVGFPNVEPITVPTDVATSASSASTFAAVDTTPADLLSQASTNFTDANQVLTQIPTVGDASTAGLLEQQNMDLQDVAQLGTSESALSSYDNGALTELLNPLFNSVNQAWDQAGEAVLNADQALQTAATSGSDTTIDSAIYGLLGAQLESPIFSSDFIDLGAHFLTGIDSFSAGLDTASALDPGIVADLLSSIGL